MPAPASHVSMVAAAPTGMAATTVHAHQATRAATAGVMWMNVGCLAYASMGVPVSTHLAPSTASVKLATQGSSVRASPHLALPLSVSTAALAVRQGNSATSVLAYLVSEQFAKCTFACTFCKGVGWSTKQVDFRVGQTLRAAGRRVTLGTQA